MDTEKRGPGRPPKTPALTEEMKRKREKILATRRGGSVGHRKRNLAVDESALDRENFEYRWVNDDPMRVHNLQTQDVWETVSGPGYQPGKDGQVEVMTGKDDQGAPVRGYLMRKPKVYFEEDKAGKRENIEQKMKQIARAEDEASVQNSYAPNGGIKVARG